MKRARTTRKSHWLMSLLVVSLSATILGACAFPKKATPPETEQPPSEQGPTPAPETQLPEVTAWLSHLTLEEKVGQMLWIGFPGPELSEESQRLLASGQAGGLILFGRQGSDPVQLQQMIHQAQEIATSQGRQRPGLLVSVDQEGGLVQRFGPPFTPWPGNMALGATGSTAHAEEIARAMAREMRAVGVNINLAPDADVNNNPANPVIGIRSFGEEPTQVARLVTAQIRGFQAEQVGAVAKHFPGHGDTTVDSHYALPIIQHPWEHLEQVELPPFRAAIEAGVDGVLAAHVIFSAVATDNLPASLSPQVITDLLKGKMGYDGVVMTDAIDGMKAITDNWGVDQAMALAVQAGVDVLLVTESFGVQQSLHQHLVQAVREGRIPESRIDDGVRRVLRLKAKHGLLPTLGSGEQPKQGAGKQPEPADLKVIGSPEHQALATKVGAEALTLVRSSHLPLKLAEAERLLVVGPTYGPEVTDVAGIRSPLGAGVKAIHPQVQEVLLPRRPSAEAQAEVRRAAEGAAAILYGVYNGHEYPEHQSLIRDLIATGKPVVVVGLGMPYELTALPEIQNYIAAYGYQAPNLTGVGPLLFGKAEAKGRLPVTIPGLYPLGHGLTR